LRPSLLIGGGVGHGNTRAIHHLDAATQPEFGGRDARGEFVGQRLVKLRQTHQRQTAACPAIGTGAAVGRLGLRRIPRLNFADDLAAGRTRTQDLAQERPKGQGQRIGALATVNPLGGGSQHRGRQPRPENLAQPAQRGLPPLLGLRPQLVKLGTALTTGQSVRKAR